MKLKTLLPLIVCILLFINPSFSQVSVGYKTAANDGEDNFKPEDLAALKKTTTVFILPGDAEASDIKDYEKAFNDVWKYTPYKVITDDQMNTLEKDKAYSYIILGGVEVTLGYRDIVTGTNHWSFCYYQLEMFNGKKEKIFAQIAVGNGYCIDKNTKGKTPNNMKPGHFKYYLSVINSHLMEGKILKVGDDYFDNSMLKNLATETLYVTDNLLHNNSGGKEKDIPEEVFFAKYPYPHKMVTKQELNELLFNSDKPFYFVGPKVFFKGRVITSVFSSQSMDPVYYYIKGKEISASGMNLIAEKIKSAVEGH